MDSSHHFGNGLAFRQKIFLRNNEETKDQPPHNIIQCAAMPEACHCPDNQKVADGSCRPFSAASERNVNVVPEPLSQRCMPAAVEFANASCRIRMREVFHKRKAEHHSDPGRHQRIAPEIIEQLEGIPVRSQPGERRRDTLKSDLRNLIP